MQEIDPMSCDNDSLSADNCFQLVATEDTGDTYPLKEVDVYNPRYIKSQLLHAITNGDGKMTTFFVKKWGDVNKKLPSGGTLLHLAVRYPEIVTILIEAGADPNAINHDGETALHLAARNNFESVATLIKAGANVDAPDSMGYRPLSEAAINNSVDALNALLESGASINSIVEDGHTPLFSAILWNNFEATELLIKKGADVNFCMFNGELPVHTAAMYADIEIMALLLEAGADIDALAFDKKRAVDYAIKRKKAQMVRFLIERGAKLPELLHYSTFGDLWAKAEHWYNEIKETDELFHDLTDMESFCRAIRLGNVAEAARIFYNNDIDINSFDNHGYTPLHWASLEGNIEIMEILLNHGANVEIPTRNGRPLLFSSAWRIFINKKREKKRLPIKQEATLEPLFFLLKRGANVNVINANGCSLLHLAALNGEIEMMRVLLDKGAIIDSQDKDGKTPLFYAVGTTPSQLKTTRFLLDRGANVNFRDIEHGRTLLHHATINRAHKIIRLLRNAGADRELKDNNGKTAEDYMPKSKRQPSNGVLGRRRKI